MLPSFPRVILAAGAAAAALAAGPGRTQQPGDAPALPPLVLENFEAAVQGARPYLWKEGRQSGVSQYKIGAQRTPLNNDSANKALKYEHSFTGAFNPADGVEAGPMKQALPGSLEGLKLMVHGDAGKNLLGVRLKDSAGETFEWRVPVTWTGWKAVSIPLNPAAALKARGDGKLDVPLTLEVVRVARSPGGSRKGEVMIDDLTAVCKFAKVSTLYDVAKGVHPELWKANRHHARIGLVADSFVQRDGQDIPALKLEYEYESGEDASVEFQRIIPAGDGHGTLIAEVYGDGSNNVVRFRLLDGADGVWQGTWAGYLVDWSGWKTLYIDTRTLRQPQGPDPTAAPEKFPLKFSSLIVDDCSASDNLPGVESGRKGEVYLGRLLFGLEK